MLEQMTATETLLDSIKDIVEEGFNFENDTQIYLDPESARLYTFHSRGSIPATAYNGIDQHVLTVRSLAIPSSVERYLLKMVGTLAFVLNSYKGTEWDGHNQIGVWSDEALESLEVLSGEAHGNEWIAYYWDACDWFEPSLDELKFRWEQGETAELIIDDEGCGSEDCLDGMCDRDEAVAWLKAEIAEWEAENEAEDDA